MVVMGLAAPMTAGGHGPAFGNQRATLMECRWEDKGLRHQAVQADEEEQDRAPGMSR